MRLVLFGILNGQAADQAPALLTRMSRVPNGEIACANKLRGAPGSDRSAITAEAVPPAVWIVFALCSGDVEFPWRTTAAPPSASAHAMAAPSPRDAPVTSAVRPCSRKESSINGANPAV